MKFRKIIFILVLVFASVSVSFAQCTTEPPCVGRDATNPEVPLGSGPLGPGDFYCCPNVTVPFDGGVSLLLAAGLGIGARSIYRRKKQQAS